MVTWRGNSVLAIYPHRPASSPPRFGLWPVKWSVMLQLNSWRRKSNVLCKAHCDSSVHNYLPSIPLVWARSRTEEKSASISLICSACYHTPSCHRWSWPPRQHLPLSKTDTCGTVGERKHQGKTASFPQFASPSMLKVKCDQNKTSVTKKLQTGFSIYNHHQQANCCLERKKAWLEEGFSRCKDLEESQCGSYMLALFMDLNCFLLKCTSITQGQSSTGMFCPLCNIIPNSPISFYHWFIWKKVNRFPLKIDWGRGS